MAETPKRFDPVVLPVETEFKMPPIPDERLRIIALQAAARSISGPRVNVGVAPEIELIRVSRAAYKFLKEDH
jgi:hypothetical protein